MVRKKLEDRITVSEALDRGACNTCVSYYPEIAPPFSTHCRSTWWDNRWRNGSLLCMRKPNSNSNPASKQ